MAAPPTKGPGNLTHDTSPVVHERRMTAIYVAVALTEVAALAALWMLGRYFGP